MLNDIFLNDLPSVDLHGLDSDMARIEINDFINYNLKLKNKKIVIIHGIGEGILFNVTKKILSTNKKVVSFKSSYFNKGITVVELKI